MLLFLHQGAGPPQALVLTSLSLSSGSHCGGRFYRPKVGFHFRTLLFPKQRIQRHPHVFAQARAELDAFRRDQTKRISELVKQVGVDLK